MADFVAVLRKTLDGLGETTPEVRARVYDKARSTIAAKLAASGVAAAERVRAIDRLEEETPDAENAAALAYAKRRRLGVFRAEPDDSPERRRKDLAALARAGFAMEVASRALKGEGGED